MFYILYGNYLQPNPQPACQCALIMGPDDPNPGETSRNLSCLQYFVWFPTGSLVKRGTYQVNKIMTHHFSVL